ncbi:MAG: hypothetical protein L0387_09170 [Acidobacteria bacterium]|nr:hypothetical protein [Acidobacteriota bacterium]MCI0718884.1 hypothetical protein [Acidobacteriota bacterium]
MAKSARILDLIYALRETDRSEGFFRPIVEAKNLTWHFEISEFDKLGLLVNHIEIKAHKASSLPPEKQFELLTNKITYLEEFALIEYDRTNAALLLRSRVPQRLGNSVSYYEIVLKGGNQLSFGRYEFDQAIGRRRMLPANLAIQTFGRLLDDFESLFSHRRNAHAPTNSGSD